jgi:hypothetical protein
MAPAALSIISVTFTEARERARAFGVYGAVPGAAPPSASSRAEC